MGVTFNPLSGNFDIVKDTSDLLKLTQTPGSEQTITGSTPKLDTLKSKSILGTDINGKLVEGTHQSLAGVVPYTGATGDVNLGANDLLFGAGKKIWWGSGDAWIEGGETADTITLGVALNNKIASLDGNGVDLGSKKITAADFRSIGGLAVAYSGEFVSTVTINSRVVTFTNDGSVYTKWEDSGYTWTPTYDVDGKLTAIGVVAK